MQNSKDDQTWKVNKAHCTSEMLHLWFWRNLNVIPYKQIFPQLSLILREYDNKDTANR